MQLIKNFVVVISFVVVVFVTHYETKESYLQRGIADGELNAKLDIFYKMKPHLSKCNPENRADEKMLFQAKNIELYVSNSNHLCFIE